MIPNLPQIYSNGNPPAKWYRETARQLRAITPSPGVGSNITTGPNGTTSSSRYFGPTPKQSNTDKPPFFVYDAGGGNIQITGGTIQHVYNELQASIASLDDTAVNDGDFVWIERIGVNTWQFNSGATLPDNYIYILLVSFITVDGTSGEITDIAYVWHGGDIILAEGTFPVKLDNDGGGPGDGAVPCSFTYTVTTMADIEIGSSMMPLNSRARIMNAVTVGADKGTAYFDATGAVVLWDANETLDQSTCVSP